MISNKDKLWTVKEVAEYLQLDEHTVYRMARKGEIPAYKVAGQWRFKKDSIEKWLDQYLLKKRDEGKSLSKKFKKRYKVGNK